MGKHCKTKKNNKGITMVSLIVTVIVLITIAGITITSLTGDNSVLGKANSAKVVQIEAASKEKMDLASQTIVIEIAEARAYDREYSAKENAADIQSKLLEILKGDSSSNTEKEGWKVGLLDEATGKFEITYEGEDYKSACNDDNAKITYTAVLGEKTIDITSTATGLKDSYGNKVEIGLGNGTSNEGSGDSGDEPEHTHTSDNGTVTKTATCTTAGVRTFKCTSCNATLKTENIPALGHNEDSGTITKTATCAAEGEKTFKCTVCKEVIRTEKIAKTGHSQDNGTVTKPAICTEKGTKTYKCTVCGTTTKTEEIAATGHTSVNGKEENIHKKCSVCGVTLEDGEEHDYTSKVTTEGNCTTDEVTTYTCGCGYTYTSVTKEATGHSEDNGTVTKPATCTEKGTKTYKCTVCSTVTKTEEIAKLSHSYTAQSTDSTYLKSAATCTANAVYYYKCSGCTAKGSNTWEKTGTATGHSYGTPTYSWNGYTSCTANRTCSKCSGKETGTATITNAVTTAATCTTAGVRTYTAKFSNTAFSTQTKTETIAATGHSQDSGTITTAATCTKAGVKTYKCTVCSAVTKTEEVAKLAHSYTAQSTDSTYLKSAATCTANAVYYYKCSGCTAKGSNTWEKTGTATGHSYGTPTYSWSGYTSCTASRTCSKCSSKETGTATITNAVTTAATCTTAGVRTYTAKFSNTAFSTQTKTESIAATGHTYNQTNTSTTYRVSTATCQKAATYYYSCSCGAKGTSTFTSGSTVAHNYNYQSTESTYLKSAATCAADATYYYRCQWCTAKGTTSWTRTGTATGNHTWDSGVVTKEPTMTTEGVRTYTCSVCKGTKTETISKLTAISKTTSYVGYYANLDSDAEPEGIIYADLAIGGSGEWMDSNGTYSYDAITGTKDYYISTESYAGAFGTKGVITVVPNTTGEERFYVMALEDFTTDSYTSFYWYYSAYSNKISDYATKTSNDFGTGRSNTETMIAEWNAETYGTQNARDMWGVIQAKVEEGWFVPSRGEWGAFGKNLGITSSNYSSYGLSSYCWSSSLRNTGTAWLAYFDYGYMNNSSIRIAYYVRLSATF